MQRITKHSQNTQLLLIKTCKFIKFSSFQSIGAFRCVRVHTVCEVKRVEIEMNKGVCN